MEKKLNKLIEDANKKISNWNERSQFKMKGVGNLSRSDIDMIVFYAQNGLKTGDPESGYRKLRGNIREVFVKYQILKM